MDDEALMARIAEGDTRAFGCLVDRYQRRLTAFAERITGDRDAAADAVQEALIGVWRARDRYEARGKAAQYLLAAVRNACLGHLRTARARPASALPDPVPCVEDGLAPASSGLEGAVRDAVLGLPAEQRDVFVLSHYEGLTYQEIACAIGCPIGTVASRKRLAVHALRRSLAAWLEE